MEHLSQAFTAPPIELSSPKVAARSHKHNVSVDSTSSTTSSKLRKFTESFRRQRAVEDSVYTMKGSNKTFRKEDIKLGELVASSNMLHCTGT
jgi:hypothetical protein